MSPNVARCERGKRDAPKVIKDLYINNAERIPVSARAGEILRRRAGSYSRRIYIFLTRRFSPDPICGQFYKSISSGRDARKKRKENVRGKCMYA